MKTPVFGSVITTPLPADNTTRYGAVNNQDLAFDTTEAIRRQIIPANCTIEDWSIVLGTAPGVGNSRTFAIRKNSSTTTTATITISGNDTTGSWTDNDETLVAGDTITIISTGSSTPDATTIKWHFKLSAGEFESIVLGNSTSLFNSFDAGIGLYGTSDIDSTSDDSLMICGTSGLMKNLYFALQTAPGSTKSIGIRLRLNGSNANPSVLIAGSSATTGNDLVNSQELAAGDRIEWRTDINNSPVRTPAAWGFVIEVDIDGESLHGGGHDSFNTLNGTLYNFIGPNNKSWTGTEANHQGITPAIDFKKLYVRLKTAPGASESRTVALRLNGSTSTLTATVSDAAITANDTVHTVTASADDPINLIHTSSATPADSDDLFFGIVAFIDPAVGGANAMPMAMNSYRQRRM